MRWTVVGKPGRRSSGSPSAPSLMGLESDVEFPAIRRARRILVLGSSGSGKTRLSQRLAGILGLDLIHLDAHFWQPGARPREEGEWRKIVSGLAQRESWIMDGTYERTLDLRVPRADAIVMLECPRSRCLRHLLRRQQVAQEARSDRAPGSAERIDLNHVRYVMRYPEVTRPKILASLSRFGADKPVAALKTPDAVDPFISTLESVAAA